MSDELKVTQIDLDHRFEMWETARAELAAERESATKANLDFVKMLRRADALEAERDAERKASSAWRDNYNIALSKAGEAARERDALRAELAAERERAEAWKKCACQAQSERNGMRAKLDVTCEALAPFAVDRGALDGNDLDTAPVSVVHLRRAHAVLKKIKGGGE